MMHATRLLAVAVAVAAASPVLAQAPPPAPATAPAPDASPAPASDTIKSIIDQELQPDPSGYSYSPQGRRDPFVSLLKPVSADQGARTRRPGMEGFLIVKGEVRDKIPEDRFVEALVAEARKMAAEKELEPASPE